jgi:uncharacterized protein (TIGR03435 family)
MMLELCTLLSVISEQRVIDETGKVGRFNFHAEFTEDLRPLLDFSHHAHYLPALSDPAAHAINPDLLSAAMALVKKLGLALDPARGPGEFIVIDHVERPNGKD